MGIRVVALTAVVACGYLSGCATDEADPHHDQVRGRFTIGDATVEYVATYQDSSLVRVEEAQSFGDLGEATATYEVVDGRLVAYRREETRQKMGRDAQGTESVQLLLEFDRQGQILHQRKLVDGQARELVGHEAPGAQRHFVELRRRAAQQHQVMQAGMR
ncbi:hypothetical protein GF314_17220 [bacterium]|nr:hypothetical protein [bacterium]